MKEKYPQYIEDLYKLFLQYARILSTDEHDKELIYQCILYSIDLISKYFDSNILINVSEICHVNDMSSIKLANKPLMYINSIFYKNDSTEGEKIAISSDQIYHVDIFNSSFYISLPISSITILYVDYIYGMNKCNWKVAICQLALHVYEERIFNKEMHVIPDHIREFIDLYSNRRV